jgi:hypothetical protein
VASHMRLRELSNRDVLSSIFGPWSCGRVFALCKAGSTSKNRSLHKANTSQASRRVISNPAELLDQLVGTLARMPTQVAAETCERLAAYRLANRDHAAFSDQVEVVPRLQSEAIADWLGNRDLPLARDLALMPQ